MLRTGPARVEATHDAQSYQVTWALLRFRTRMTIRSGDFKSTYPRNLPPYKMLPPVLPSRRIARHRPSSTLIDQGRPSTPYLAPQQRFSKEHDRPRSTAIKHQRANGIQEVDGSIPFGSTNNSPRIGNPIRGELWFGSRTPKGRQPIVGSQEVPVVWDEHAVLTTGDVDEDSMWRRTEFVARLGHYAHGLVIHRMGWCFGVWAGVTAK